MSRIRTLKPEILDDERTASLTDAAFRLLVAAILLADDYGNLQAEPRWITRRVWWAHDKPPKAQDALAELVAAGLIIVYEVRGQTYLSIRTWSKHQRIDNAGKPRVPAPNDPDARNHTDAETRGDSPRNSASRGDSPPDPDPDHDPEGTSTSTARRRTRRAMTEIPADWIPNGTARAKATELRVDLQQQAERFANHARQVGRTCKDWDAAFLNWLLKAADMRAQMPLTAPRAPAASRGLTPEEIGAIADRLEAEGL